MQDNKNVFIVGGGTAGHSIPAIQVSRELIKNNYKVIFITDYRMFRFVSCYLIIFSGKNVIIKAGIIARARVINTRFHSLIFMSKNPSQTN